MKALLAVCLSVVGLCCAAEQQTYKVTTIMEAPYVIKKEGVTNPTSHEDYDGFIPDLLSKISAHTGHKFTLKIVGDGKYGAKVDGSWNGMIGEVIQGQADFAAAPLTVSPERSEVVDFTEHFMTFDTIVMLKREPESMKIRSALELFNKQNETKIKYGVVKDGFTENFFKTTQQDIYKKMYASMDKSQFPTTSGAGVRKVQTENGKFAFVIESSTAEYWMNRKPCDLISFRLGSALPYHNYSFAVKKSNTEIKDQLNRALKSLKSEGEHDVLKAKWWPTECSSSHRPMYTFAGLISGLLVAFVAGTKRL